MTSPLLQLGSLYERRKTAGAALDSTPVSKISTSDDSPNRPLVTSNSRTMLKYFKKVVDEKSWLPNRITEYHPNIRESVRRKYYSNGPCQPRLDEFPQRKIDGKLRRFNHSWFKEFGWLEYSVSVDASFCLCCYLFKNEMGHQGGGDTFVTEAKLDYSIRLNASIDCIRWLLAQGLAFRGHDESDKSRNQGNFLELLKFLANHDENVLKNAPINLQLTSPRIQKEIVHACAFETTKAIIKELGDGFFCVLLDDSRDVSTKEQMTVVLRFVDKNGCVVERILGFKHVMCTTAISLKGALEEILNSHGLNMSMLRGQGYDGATNMKDNLREKQSKRIVKALENEEITSGRGLNQESTLIRHCDTRWSSHYNTILSLIYLFDSVIDVLRVIVNERTISNQRGEASRLVKDMLSFDFSFDLHLMKKILRITNYLSQALQKKNQDIVNAMNLVDISKKRLQEMRDNGWDKLVEEVSIFCIKHKIEAPDIDDVYVNGKRPKRRVEEMTNSHRYRVEVFNIVIDMQLLELNDRFNEVNTELSLCVACLNPSDSFKAFNKDKLVRLAAFYPNDFQGIEVWALSEQLENFVLDMRSYMNTSNVNGLGDLAQKLVESNRDKVYPLVYKLITLALILPVGTATVERAFSTMNIVKIRLRNRMSDEWMNDNLVIYLEKDLFKQVSNEAIIHKFHKIGNRRGQL
ncbi:hypothetical protein OROMI_027124 [Orobanche minor]